MEDNLELEKTIVFVRHGEIYSGSWLYWRTTHFFFSDVDDPPLSDEGFKKSEDVALCLKNQWSLNFDEIVVSPFTRCIQTALQIQKIFPHTNPLNTNILLGEYQQFPWEYKCALYPKGLPKEYNSENYHMEFTYPETQSQMNTRCDAFLDEISKKKTNTIVVSHGSLMNYFAKRLLPKDEEYNIKFSGFIVVNYYNNINNEVFVIEDPII